MKQLPEDLAKSLQNKLDAFAVAYHDAGLNLPVDDSFTDVLKHVFLYSDFVAKTCTRKPEILDDLLKSGDLNKAYSKEHYNHLLYQDLLDSHDEPKLGTILRNRRSREMVRIAWRDLSGQAGLVHTMKDLSSLADACIDNAFAFLYRLHCYKFGTPVNDKGTPQHMVVLGLGKLGATELNFSSDVDLIFTYPENGITVYGPQSISNAEFFTGLSRRFLKVFALTTPDGILFRVDLRLRPFGENGPLIMTFNETEDYYQRQGREWERYALIKARPVAGDKKSGQLLLERLKPFVYRRYLDFGVYDSLREMKQKISLEVERRGLKENIKLGAGGIREIEFFGQIFQLIRGGVEPALQERRILKILEILVRENYIPQTVCHELTTAYNFLRKTENRLQEFADLQTHDIPVKDAGRHLLAKSMEYEVWGSYYKDLQNHMEKVHFHFNELLAAKNENDAAKRIDHELSLVWEGMEDKNQFNETLMAAGFEQPQEIANLLDFLRNDSETRSLSSEGRKRLDKLIPIVLKKAGLSKQPVLVLQRITDLIKAIERRTCYLSLLLENPDVLNHIVRLSIASPWIISYLAQHPLLLDELIDTRTLYLPPERKDLETALAWRLAQIPEQDLELRIDELIIFKHVNTLRVAAADVTGAFPLMKVSDYLSDIAETILEQIVGLAWHHLVNKHGRPVCHLGETACDKGFAVIAYGKLGGLELGYGSDLDLVFLHAGAAARTKSTANPIDTSQFYARLGQRIIHILTTHSRAGRLYEIDMRLRPSGNSGPLVINIEAFGDYQAKEAWTWEHQALVRARPICGDAAVINHFKKIRKDILCRPRDLRDLRKEVRKMRERLRKEHDGRPLAGQFNIKHGKGGVMDIEFLVQYLVLLHAHKHPELVEWSDNIRQIEALAKTSIFEKDIADFLTDAYIALRSKIHKLSLQETTLTVPEEQFQEFRDKTIKIWDRYLGA